MERIGVAIEKKFHLKAETKLLLMLGLHSRQSYQM